MLVVTVRKLILTDLYQNCPGNTAYRAIIQTVESFRNGLLEYNLQARRFHFALISEPRHEVGHFQYQVTEIKHKDLRRRHFVSPGTSGHYQDLGSANQNEVILCRGSEIDVIDVAK